MYDFEATECKADFDHWLMMDHYTTYELTLLSLKKDPRIIKRTSLDRARNHRKDDPFLKAFDDRYEIIGRRFSILLNEHKLSDFLIWAKSLNLNIPKAMKKDANDIDHKALFIAEQKKTTSLQKQVRDFEEQITRIKKDTNAKRLNTARKLVLGMAAAHYGYQPGITNFQITGKGTKSIYADLKSAQLELSDNSITTFFEEAETRIDTRGIIEQHKPG